MKVNYKKVCSDLLKGLDLRTSEVIERRFGLKTGERETLEAIGKDHGITRERIRQIEREGILVVKDKLDKYSEVFQDINKALDNMGGLRREDLLLSELGDEKNQNEVYFLLNLNKKVSRNIETDNFHTFWTKNPKGSALINKASVVAVKELKKDNSPLGVEALFKRTDKGLNKRTFASCLEISKDVDFDIDGRYGLVNWVEVNPRGIKDKAYLVLKKKEKPVHFSEIASLIEELLFSDKKVHTATVHNELIKDNRFVLVGRGLYALKEWGYEPGVVKDVISKVLKNSGKPLTKEEIAQRVSEQRFVKENTVFLNLHDRERFEKDPQGRYTVKES